MTTNPVGGLDRAAHLCGRNTSALPSPSCAALAPVAPTTPTLTTGEQVRVGRMDLYAAAPYSPMLLDMGDIWSWLFRISGVHRSPKCCRNMPQYPQRPPMTLPAGSGKFAAVVRSVKCARCSSWGGIRWVQQQEAILPNLVAKACSTRQAHCFTGERRYFETELPPRTCDRVEQAPDNCAQRSQSFCCFHPGS